MLNCICTYTLRCFLFAQPLSLVLYCIVWYCLNLQMMDGERQEREGAAKAQKEKPTAREPAAAAENRHNEGTNAAVAAAHTHIGEFY